jgi:SAM-dependent methyltransferase
VFSLEDGGKLAITGRPIVASQKTRMTPAPPCKVCNGPTIFLGEKHGKITEKVFEIYRCSGCGFAFVGNPWTDFAQVYSQKYYEGRGTDPLVDYVFELDFPDRTIRKYEWQGLLDVVRTLLGRDQGFRWLDYGCGNGGLVRFGRQNTGIEIFGFEEGWIADKARRSGIPLLDRNTLGLAAGSFDVITAIEVMEHTLDPIDTLRHIRKLLKPGGLFLCTTGNARKHRSRLLQWTYIVPEIHLSFFEPATLEVALNRTGFRAEYRGFVAGHTKIIQGRVLKNLRVRTRSPWQRFLPWPVMARIIDYRVGFTDHPIGWAE